MCIEYRIQVDMYHVSAQGVDERMINVDSSSSSSSYCILVDKMEYKLETACNYSFLLI